METANDRERVRTVWRDDDGEMCVGDKTSGYVAVSAEPLPWPDQEVAK